jgi:ABC-type transport system substrate-binding protein
MPRKRWTSGGKVVKVDRLEALRDAFSRSSSPEEQKNIAADIQKEVYNQVIYIPLGQYLALRAWRKSPSGVLPTVRPPGSHSRYPA